nr:7816_t:CDS:2 [Entrophospora candida]
MKGFCQVVDVDYEVIDNEEIYKLTENLDFDEQDNHMELGPQAMYYKSSTSVSSTSSNEDRSEENFVPAYQNESLIIDQSNITAEEDKVVDFLKTGKPSIVLLPTRFAGPDGIVATNSPGIFVFFSSALRFNGEINHTKSNNNSLRAHYNKVHNLIETDYIQVLSERLYIEKILPEDEEDINNAFKSLTAPEQMVLFKKFRYLEHLEIFREQLDYLRIKGSVHVRGVLERWEERMMNIRGNRKERWKKYLEENPKLLETFQKFWKHRQNQTIPIDVNFVAGEMQALYKWMSERIHNVNARGDVVEWSKSDLGNGWSQVVEYMCKDLNIKYEVFGNENENAP